MKLSSLLVNKSRYQLNKMVNGRRKHEPNFQTMSRKELRAYVLEHRDNTEVFYAYMDKSKVEGNWIKHPPFKYIDDLENHSEFIEKVRQEGEKYRN